MKISSRPWIVLLMGLLAVGCNDRPDMPSRGFLKGRVDTLTVDSSNNAEMRLAAQAKAAYMRYELALSDLGAYYDQIGAVQKQQWVEEEMNNLREAHAATIQGTADVDVAAPAPDDVASEQMLVENVMDARRGYRTAMDTLAQLYERQGNTRKALIVHTMQNRFHPEETHAYMVTVALPPKDLEPSELIPEANALFDRAEELHEEGALIPAAADYDKERRALELFQSLIRRYPTSTRIPMAAFYIAEIYKEYFGEHYLSTLWYERAWTWDPNIAAPARFQCALQYDIHINDYRTAVDLYRASIEHEPYYPSHVRFAQRRIEEIQEYLANRGELERRPALPEGQVRQLPQ